MEAARELKILYLEDNPLDVELTRSRLEVEGLLHRMTHLRTRAEFLDAMQKGGFDVLMIDYSVPGFAGLEALEIARALYPDAPILIISGTIGEEIAIDTMRRGANDYVLKNRISRLSPAIRRVVQEAEDRRRRKEAEKARREAEARYRTLFEASPEAVFLIDGQGIIRDCNPEAERLLGIPAGRIVGRSGSAFGFLGRFSAGDAAASARDAGDAGHPSPSEERIDATGPGRWVEVIPGRVSVDGGRGFQVIVRDITSRKLAEERIQNSLREKEVMLREIHHRVKNNLQIICGLLAFRSDASGAGPGGMCLDCRNRITTMALIHERLTHSDDLSRIPFRESAHSLVSERVLSMPPPRRVSFELDIADATFTLPQAVPLALILNELVNQSLRNTCEAGRKGSLRVSLTSDGRNVWVLEVRDNGAGPAPESGADVETGMRLVQMLVEQIHGEMTVTAENGTVCRIRFPAASDFVKGA
ncbi:PAS domain S-box protein [bacterium]|nr:PAS domain S-box protein [bacterium]